MMVARSLRRRLVEIDAPAAEALRSTVDGHLSLLTDLSLLPEDAPGADLLRAQLAAILAAAAGELDAALKAVPGRDGKPPGPAAIRRALAKPGRRCSGFTTRRAIPEGGCPLYAGTVAIQRRLLGRIALDFFQVGDLDPDRALANLEQARERSCCSSRPPPGWWPPTRGGPPLRGW